MRANLLPKSLKFRSFPGLRPLDPPGALRRPPNPMPLKQKSTPLHQNSWNLPCSHQYINRQALLQPNLLYILNYICTCTSVYIFSKILIYYVYIQQQNKNTYTIKFLLIISIVFLYFESQSTVISLITGIHALNVTQII